MKLGRAARNKARRSLWKRLSLVVKSTKRWAWRTSSLALWAQIVLYIAFRHDVFYKFEQYVMYVAVTNAGRLGFSPSHSVYLPMFVKVFWVLLISGFNWLQVVGFAIYVLLSPLVLLWNCSFWFLYKFGKLKKSVAPEPKSGPWPLTRRKQITTTLYWLLAGWCLLFLRSTQRPAILVAALITAALFTLKLYQTTIRIGVAEIDRTSLMFRIAWSPYDFVVRALSQLARGKVKDQDLLGWIRVQRWFLRLLRRLSLLFQGKAAERRVAVFVLLAYSGNLLALAALVIAFWAFCLKFAALPAQVKVTDALLASASRVIPGITTPDGLIVSRSIQIGASLSAWLIFFLYVGPVASMFPVLLERHILAVKELREQMRQGRGNIYRLLDALTTFHQRVIVGGKTFESPSLPSVAEADRNHQPSNGN